MLIVFKRKGSPMKSNGEPNLRARTEGSPMKWAACARHLDPLGSTPDTEGLIGPCGEYLFEGPDSTEPELGMTELCEDTRVCVLH
jgi:hypothetical protein